jgi:type IV pilus assembly protein PilX
LNTERQAITGLSLANQSKTLRAQQTGAALIVVLLFTLAMTTIALWSARSVSLSERLARNQLDAQVAREAAEAALRDAEFDLLLTNGNIRTGAYCARGHARPVNEGVAQFSATCQQGQCAIHPTRYDRSNYKLANVDNNSVAEPWWPASKGGQWNDQLNSKPSGLNLNCNFSGGVPFGTFTGRPKIIGVSRQSEYLIEYFRLGQNNLFRISARGFGRNPNTEIVLQSYFHPFE